MSLFGRLREAIGQAFSSISGSSRRTEEIQERITGDDIVRDWLGGDSGPIQEAPSSDFTALGDWESGLYADIVPESHHNDPRLVHAFDVGFGEGMQSHTSQEIREAREEFEEWLADMGIELDDDFWADWREAYEEAG
jgi:hypothetical protein